VLEEEEKSCGGISLDKRKKIGMDTNKALVLNDRGHHSFSLFFFFGSKTNFASSRTKSVFIVLDSGLL